MSIRPLGFLGPKVKDFQKSGVQFEVQDPPERLQGYTLTTVAMEQKPFRRTGKLQVYKTNADGFVAIDAIVPELDKAGAALARPANYILAFKKTMTGRIRMVDEQGKAYKLRILA